MQGRLHPLALLLLLLLLALPACTAKKNTLVHPSEPQVRQAVDHYFATWSKPDMEAYGRCFHPLARIFFIEKSGQVTSQNLTDFLHGQRMSHAQSAEPMKEFPVQTDILMDDIGAQAKVTWLLTKGSTQQRGTDLFTFKRDGNDWKIVSLVFYGG